jgi:hypothetical protein
MPSVEREYLHHADMAWAICTVDKQQMCQANGWREWDGYHQYTKGNLMVGSDSPLLLTMDNLLI